MKAGMTTKQRKILHHSNKASPLITILEGAVRSGKTWLDNLIWMQHIWNLRDKGFDFIVTGHTIGSIERNVLKPLYDMFGVDTKLNKHNQFKMLGNTINCFGADKMDAYKVMTGMTSHGWYGNEITLQHENTIQEAFNRCSGDGYRIFWDTNPDYPEHPVKLQYINKSGEKLESGRLRIQAWHFKITDNPYLSKEYVENLKASTPTGMWYDRAINGLWVAAEGLIYTDWDPNIHVIEPFEIPADWQRVRAIDLGYVNPFVCLWGAIDHDGRLYVYDEHYEAGKLIEHHAAAIKQSTDPVVWTVRDHDAQEGAELEKNLIYTIPAKKDVLPGIQKVAARLKTQPDGKPRLYIMDSCPNTRREVGKYQWLKKKAA